MEKYRLRTIENDDSYLRQKSKDVKKNDPNLKEYINILKNYCENNEVFAMASIQLGIPLKIIYLKNAELDNTGSSTDEGIVLINPEILNELGKTYYWESCESQKVLGKVYRPYYVKIRYYNENFEKKEIEFEGMYATVISHEYDHLFGIIHTDIATELSDCAYEDRKEFRKQNGYTLISKKCEYNHPIRGKESIKYRLRTIENDESYLRQKSKDVKEKDFDLKHDIDVVSNYCRKDGNMIALASIQIGIPKKIIYIMKTDEYDVAKEKGFEDKKIVMINPKIVEEKGETYYWENCASCLDNMGRVKRPYYIKVVYYDENFNKKEEVFKGFKATVFSHEYDHLFGILHIDIADKIYNMPLKERRKFRQKEENKYKVISRTCSYKHPLR